MAKHVVVVGGGIAGLIAAADLAKGGARVTLLEAAADLGGRARTRRADGFAFNIGPHALYAGGAFHAALKDLGVAVPGRPPRLGGGVAVVDGRMHPLPVSLKSLMRTDLFRLRDKIAYLRVMAAVQRGDRPDGSLGDWLDAQKPTPRVRQAFEALVRLTAYADAPYLVSAAAALDQVRLGLKGVIYVDGGWATLVEGLAGVAKAGGVKLTAGMPVAAVQASDVGLALRIEGGGEVSADAVLLALGPKEAAALAPGSKVLERIAREAVAVRLNVLDIGLKQRPEKAVRFALGVDQPLYLSMHSDTARLAPDGGALVHVARYLPPVAPLTGEGLSELEALADLAMPGWREQEVRRQVLRAMPVAHDVPRFGQRRIGVRLEDAPGVFVAGDWVGDTGMLSDCAAASAREAAAAILARPVARGLGVAA